MKKSNNTIIICLTVIICILISSFSAIYISKDVLKTVREIVPMINKTTQVTVPVVQTTKEETTTPATTESFEETTTQEPAETTTKEESTTKEKATDKQTTKTTAKKTTAKATTKKTTKTTVKTTAKMTSKTTTKPSKEQILANYNNAVNKVISSKAGFTKVRTTDLKKLEGGALMKNSAVKNAVSDFLGVGSKTFTTSKGKSENISKASLTLSDVKDATCSSKDGKYTYTITLKDGISSFNPDSNSSPLDKTGLYVGLGDKSAYDHKTASNLAAAINNTDGASVKAVKENSTNSKCVAVVDIKSGKLQSLTISFDYSVSLTTIKYTFLSINSANGSASTKVEFKDIKW